MFDLDPSKDDPAAVRAAAIDLRDLLDELSLPSWIKTSGSKGFHIVVPLDGKTHIHEVERGKVQPRSFTLRNMPARVAKLGDVWADMRRRGRSLTRAIETLRRLGA